MRKGALALVLLLAGTAAAQEKLDPRLRGLLARPTPASGYALQGLMPDPAVDRFSVFVRLAPGADLAAFKARFPAADFGPPSGDIVTVALSLADVARLGTDPAVASAHGARPVKLTMDIVRSSVQSGGLWLGVVDATSIDFGSTLGSGVVVGIIDSGIDYKHADFYTEGSPNKTRILAIWDQTDAVGPAPGGFTKGGSHWTRAQIDDEIDGSPAGVVRQVDTNGHGTHVAGVAAGDGSSTDGDLPAGTFRGLAPQADIVMVKSDLTDTGISEGLQFIIQKAAADGKRAVINLSLGTQYGPHDGTGALDVAVGNVAASTPVAVAMGNEQADSVHASTTVVASGTALFTASTGATSMSMDFWVPSGDLYTVKVATSATGTTVQCLPGTDCTSLSLAGNAIEIYNTAGAHPSGDREMFIEISRGAGITSGNWRVTLERGANGATGRIDGWMVSGGRFTSLVDSSGTVSSPATANNVVAVGSYCSKRSWTADDNGAYNDSTCTAPLLGDISAFSNHGPTRDGRMKPDVAAPGQRVAAALSADISPSEPASTVARDGRHRLMNGTSMATPVVAGALARSVQAAPGVTAASARSAIQTQARSDAKVTGHGGLPNYVFGYGKLNVLGCGDTVLSAPSAAVPTVLGTSSVSWTWASLSGATSYSVAYASSPAVVVGSTGNPVYVQLGLTANTTTAIRVFGVNACGAGPGQDSASTSTLSVPIASFASVPHVSSVTVAWTALPAAPRASSSFGYRVEASLSPTFAGTVFSSATPVVTTGSLVVSGLTAFATYYLRVGALNEPGAPHYVPGASVFTRTTLAPPAVGTFTVHSASVIEASWDLGANPAGLLYEADASSASNFSGTLTSSQTYALSALFAGLSPNVTYYFRVHATTGPYAALGSTATLADVPAAASPPFPQVFQTSMTFAWGENSNPGGTRWLAEIAADAGFTISAQSSATLNKTASFTGLTKNSTFYARVLAVNVNGVPSAYLTGAATSTLTDPPTAAGTPFAFVGASSVSVNWTALPLVPAESSCEGYVVEASTAPNFSGTRYSARTSNPSETSLPVAGLLQDTTFYFRVGALNWNSVGVFSAAVSTKTQGTISSTGTAQSGQTLVVTLNPSVPQLSNVRIDAPPGTFPDGTAVTINATIVGGLPPPTSNQGTLTALGGSAGVDISAGGLQPARDVAVRFTYVPANLPAGTDLRRLVIARHTGAGWTILPSVVDLSANTVTAQTRHFSLFAPFVSTPGTSLDSVQAFPSPWKVGSGDPRFDAATLSFTNLPEGGEVRILTILGEDVRRLNAGPAGSAQWDGLNDRGSKVGSGTYIVVVSGAGSRKVLRVAVVR